MLRKSSSNSNGLKITAWKEHKDPYMEGLENRLKYLNDRTKRFQDKRDTVDSHTVQWASITRVLNRMSEEIDALEQQIEKLNDKRNIFSWQVQSKTWETDENWAINEDDFVTLSEEDIDTKVSEFWDKIVGDYVVIKSDTLQREGRVLGFNKFPQAGRIMYVETGVGKYVYIDALTAGEQVVGSKLSWQQQEEETGVGDTIRITKNIASGGGTFERLWLYEGQEGKVTSVDKAQNRYEVEVMAERDHRIVREEWWIFGDELEKVSADASSKLSWQQQVNMLSGEDWKDNIGEQVVYLVRLLNRWHVITGVILDGHTIDDPPTALELFTSYAEARNFAENWAVDKGAFYTESKAERIYLGKEERHQRGSTVASDDPSFDDYDKNDKNMKRNDFFKYDKDDMPAIDVLDDQQIYHTDKMYLKDNQKTQKEREAFDWTGRENLQLGFGSFKKSQEAIQKLSWEVQPEKVEKYYRFYMSYEEFGLHAEYTNDEEEAEEWSTFVVTILDAMDELIKEGELAADIIEPDLQDHDSLPGKYCDITVKAFEQTQLILENHIRTKTKPPFTYFTGVNDASQKLSWQVQSPMPSDIVKILEQEETDDESKNRIKRLLGLYLITNVAADGNHISAIRISSVEEADNIVNANFSTSHTSAGYAGGFNWEIIERGRYSEEQWNNAVDKYEEVIKNRPRTHFTQHIGDRTPEWFSGPKLSWQVQDTTIYTTGFELARAWDFPRGVDNSIYEERTATWTYKLNSLFIEALTLTQQKLKSTTLQVPPEDLTAERNVVLYDTGELILSYTVSGTKEDLITLLQTLLSSRKYKQYLWYPMTVEDLKFELDDTTSSLKFSDTYFDSSPAEANPVEESKLVNPIDDKHHRRTNPKRHDKRQDIYQEKDTDIANRYDNAIQGDASLKLSWQMQVIYTLHDVESGEIFCKGSKEDIEKYWWNALYQNSSIGGYKLVKPIGDEGYEIVDAGDGETFMMNAIEEELRNQWFKLLEFHGEIGTYGFFTEEEYREEYGDREFEIQSSQKLSWQIHEVIAYKLPEDVQLLLGRYAKVGLGVVKKAEKGVYTVIRLDRSPTVDTLDGIMEDDEMMEGLYVEQNFLKDNDSDSPIDVITEDAIVKRYNMPDSLTQKYTWQEPLIIKDYIDVVTLESLEDEDIGLSYKDNANYTKNMVASTAPNARVIMLASREAADMWATHHIIEGSKEDHALLEKDFETDELYDIQIVGDVDEYLNNDTWEYKVIFDTTSKLAWKRHKDPEPKLPPVGAKVKCIKDGDYWSEGWIGEVYKIKSMGEKAMVAFDDGHTVGVHRRRFYEYFSVYDSLTEEYLNFSSSNSAGLKIFSWKKEPICLD